jgi:hypothetical protein
MHIPTNIVQVCKDYVATLDEATWPDIEVEIDAVHTLDIYSDVMTNGKVKLMAYVYNNNNHHIYAMVKANDRK